MSFTLTPSYIENANTCIMHFKKAFIVRYINYTRPKRIPNSNQIKHQKVTHKNGAHSHTIQTQTLHFNIGEQLRVCFWLAPHNPAK